MSVPPAPILEIFEKLVTVLKDNKDARYLVQTHRYIVSNHKDKVMVTRTIYNFAKGEIRIDQYLVGMVNNDLNTKVDYARHPLLTSAFYSKGSWYTLWHQNNSLFERANDTSNLVGLLEGARSIFISKSIWPEMQKAQEKMIQDAASRGDVAEIASLAEGLEGMKDDVPPATPQERTAKFGSGTSFMLVTRKGDLISDIKDYYNGIPIGHITNELRAEVLDASFAPRIEEQQPPLTAEEMQVIMRQTLEKNYAAKDPKVFGMELLKVEGEMLIVNVLKGSAADKAGLTQLTKVIAINGMDLQKLDNDKIKALLAKSDIIEVVTENPGGEPKIVKLQRELMSNADPKPAATSP
ncbi:hypothetical protein DB346_13635 [Verrucomicrobia bacterium LW23]|nr:hypothetical protein DB346_13635 [Verrucomicrobia bacterium LW23]